MTRKARLHTLSRKTPGISWGGEEEVGRAIGAASTVNVTGTDFDTPDEEIVTESEYVPGVTPVALAVTWIVPFD